jgi:hypothetical protein
LSANSGRGIAARGIVPEHFTLEMLAWRLAKLDCNHLTARIRRQILAERSNFFKVEQV